jgi:hypothetical protein
LKKATEAFEKESQKTQKKRTTRTIGGGRQKKKEYANMRCKAKHICYITKDGGAHLSNIIDVGFLKLKNEFMASKDKKKREYLFVYGLTCFQEIGTFSFWTDVCIVVISSS